MLTVHVLNLKRRPDRRQAFAHWNTNEGLDIQFVEAVDGAELQFADLVRQGIVNQRYTHFTAGNLGCACSHKLMWERAVRENRSLIICEDDAILRGDFTTAAEQLFKELPPAWDFLTFSYNFDSVIDVEIIPQQNLRCSFSNPVFSEAELNAFVTQQTEPIFLPLNNAFGTSAYAISVNGAKQLLELCFPMAGLSIGVAAMNRIMEPTETIDAIMNAHYRKLRAYCAIPPLAVALNEQQTSDTVNSPRLG